MEKENHPLKPAKVAEASLSLAHPIVVKVGNSKLHIGNKEEFLHRRLAIQAAAQRAKNAVTYTKSGKGRKRKLKAMNRFKEKVITSKNILEVGSQNINGTIKDYYPEIESKMWVGLDIGEGKDVDFTIVQGVNSKQLKKEHNIISNGSCTTNCLAPVAMILDQGIGIESGFMTTIHSYTGDQKLLDTLHKDLRRARSTEGAMIPTSTGAAKAMSLVLPSLKGKLDGTAIRVPTPNVSLIDLTLVTDKEATPESINEAMTKAARGELKGILDVNQKPLVSKDFNHNPHSSIFDVTQTQVIKGKFSRVLSWYDNEWGFSNRMCDTSIQIAGLI